MSFNFFFISHICAYIGLRQSFNTHCQWLLNLFLSFAQFETRFWRRRKMTQDKFKKMYIFFLTLLFVHFLVKSAKWTTESWPRETTLQRREFILIRLWRLLRSGGTVLVSKTTLKLFPEREPTKVLFAEQQHSDLSNGHVSDNSWLMMHYLHNIFIVNLARKFLENLAQQMHYTRILVCFYHQFPQKNGIL